MFCIDNLDISQDPFPKWLGSYLQNEMVLILFSHACFGSQGRSKNLYSTIADAIVEAISPRLRSVPWPCST